MRAGRPKRRAPLRVVLPLVAAFPLALSLAATLLVSPRRAGAAFELRDASPAALGAASLDVPADALAWGSDPGDPWGPMRGPWAALSRADLYGIAGLAFERTAAGLRGKKLESAFSYARTGGAGSRESTLRLEARELGDRAVAAGAAVERLGFAIDGEPEMGGWAASVAVRARLTRRSARGDLTVVADRIARSSALERLGVGASVVFVARAASGPVALAYVDRASGERGSPRLAADLALGEGASLRVARGRAPGRFGFAVALRWNGIAVSAGRLDDAGGGVVSAVEIRIGANRARGSARSANRTSGAPRGLGLRSTSQLARYRCW